MHPFICHTYWLFCEKQAPCPLSHRTYAVARPHPIAVIGTGHAGLRQVWGAWCLRFAATSRFDGQAMWFLKHKEYNFVVYDRKARS